MGCHLSGLLRTVATVSCYDCHGSGAAATQAWPNGTVFPNNNRSHTAHSAFTGITCAACHNGAGTGTASHGGSNRTAHTVADVNVVLGALAGTAATWATGPETCSASVCHGRLSPVWGSANNASPCLTCHGVLAGTFTTISSANVAPGGTGVATDRQTTGTRAGTHQVHLTAAKGMSRKVLCSDCHVNVANTPASISTHLNMTTATMTFSAIANGSKASTPRSAYCSPDRRGNCLQQHLLSCRLYEHRRGNTESFV